MKYFFILGSQPALSLAELSAVFDLKKNDSSFELIGQNILILENKGRPLGRQLINELGGTIKFGLIVYESGNDQNKLKEKVKGIALALASRGARPGKFNFGFSNYSAKLNIKPLAMETKNLLKARGIGSRWVTSREKTLSSVVVGENNLLEGGLELVLAEGQNGFLLGQTLAVQPFKNLSRRDYGRPARDAYSGMLPPKLALIMINLATLKNKEARLLDPFCGSGTILTEAALLGYRNLIGSDISVKAVADTRKNLEWVVGNCHRLGGVPFRREQLATGNWKIYQNNTKEITKKIESSSIDAIVTEPYLGPPRGKIDTIAVVKELEALYAKSLVEFKKILKPGGHLVMVWPIFRTAQGLIMLNKKIARSFNLIKPLPDKLIGDKIKLTNRQTIIYGRAEQKVWREIVILEK